MRYLSIFYAFIVLVTSSAMAQIAFARKDFSPGTIRTESAQVSYEIGPMKQIQNTKKRETIRAVKGESVEKIEVRYEEMRAGNKTMPVDGKTYIIERNGKGTKITNSTGKQPSRRELLIVSTEYPNLDMVAMATFATYFDGKKLKVGEKLDELPEAIARQFMKGARAQIDKIEMVLQKVETKNGIQQAIFETTVDASSPPMMGMQMKVEIKGKTVVDSHCRFISSEMDGPIQLLDTNGMQRGQGHISHSYVCTYSKK